MQGNCRREQKACFQFQVSGFGCGSVIELSIPAITTQTLIGNPLTISSGDFSLDRDVDTASPKIMQAVTMGKQSAADVKFFDSVINVPPVADLSFGKVLPSSYQYWEAEAEAFHGNATLLMLLRRSPWP
jgi:hypothetical protein